MFIQPREEGQGLVEYALILVLVAMVVIAILLLYGRAVANAFEDVVACVDSPSTCHIDTADNPKLTLTATRAGPTVQLSATITGLPDASGTFDFSQGTDSPFSTGSDGNASASTSFGTPAAGTATVSAGGMSASASYGPRP